MKVYPIYEVQYVPSLKSFEDVIIRVLAKEDVAAEYVTKCNIGQPEGSNTFYEYDVWEVE
jgi:hypothetical protein